MITIIDKNPQSSTLRTVSNTFLLINRKKNIIYYAKIHYLGENGNWWIGDSDTGVNASGIKGDTGNGIANVTTEKKDGITTVTITLTDETKEPVVFTIADGVNGADGVGISKIEKTATDGNDDTYTITFTNNKTFKFTVTNGKDGKDGLTPFIGDNGNWWIGDTDTGVKAAADSAPFGIGGGTNTFAIIAIIIAALALIGNIVLLVWTLGKKKSQSPAPDSSNNNTDAK